MKKGERNSDHSIPGNAAIILNSQGETTVIMIEGAEESELYDKRADLGLKVMRSYPSS